MVYQGINVIIIGLKAVADVKGRLGISRLIYNMIVPPKKEKEIIDRKRCIN
jgi:hypothetical protein